MKTKDWKSIEEAKALIIGHDPRLQKSETIAPFALFADYYFKQEPTKPNERSKYALAKATFDQIVDITNSRIDPKSIYITNLCNFPLPHAPKNKNVLIPKDKAKAGLKNIENILFINPTIEYIFPMSLQVNYWLQKLDLYESNNDFRLLTEPKKVGLLNDPPYYQPMHHKTFTLICGNVYKVKNGNQKVVPILHTKNYPLKGKFLDVYGPSYDRIREFFHK